MNFHSAVLRRIEQKLWAYTKIYFFYKLMKIYADVILKVWID